MHLVALCCGWGWGRRGKRVYFEPPLVTRVVSSSGEIRTTLGHTASIVTTPTSTGWRSDRKVRARYPSSWEMSAFSRVSLHFGLNPIFSRGQLRLVWLFVPGVRWRQRFLVTWNVSIAGSWDIVVWCVCRSSVFSRWRRWRCAFARYFWFWPRCLAFPEIAQQLRP